MCRGDRVRDRGKALVGMSQPTFQVRELVLEPCDARIRCGERRLELDGSRRGGLLVDNRRGGLFGRCALGGLVLDNLFIERLVDELLLAGDMIDDLRAMLRRDDRPLRTALAVRQREHVAGIAHLAVDLGTRQ
jgi:hypothetical protein